MKKLMVLMTAFMLFTSVGVNANGSPRDSKPNRPLALAEHAQAAMNTIATMASKSQ